MKRKLVFFFFILSSVLYGQNADSLMGIWRNQELPDSVRNKAILKLYDYYSTYNVDSALAIVDEYLTFCEHCDNTEWMAGSYRMRAQAMVYTGDKEKSLQSAFRALEIFQRSGDMASVALTYSTLVATYWVFGDLLEGLRYGYKGLEVAEQIDDKDLLMRMKTSLGLIFWDIRDYKKALEFQNEAASLSLELGDLFNYGITHSNISLILLDQGKYREAFQYNQLAYKYIDRRNNAMMGWLNYTNGLIYYQMNETDSSEKYLNLSLKARESLGDRQATAATLVYLGKVCLMKGHPLKAIEYCSKGSDVASFYNDYKNLENGCECLSQAYKTSGDLQTAYVFLDSLKTIRDSLSNNSKRQEVIRLTFEHESENEQLQQKLSYDRQLLKERNRRNVFLFAGLGILFIAGGLFSRLRYIRKTQARFKEERDLSDRLLLNILPAEVAEELKAFGKARAQKYDEATILFTDFKDFTIIAEKLTAEEIVEEVNHCFIKFDEIITRYGIEKIKTIGDAYMAVGGLPVPDKKSAENVVMAALEMQAFIIERNDERVCEGKPAFEMRAGIHSGPVVAGIVGHKKFQYDIWGDSVNCAARIEETCEVGKVNISRSTYNLIKDNSVFSFTPRGEIIAKNKGAMEMYFVSMNASHPA